MFSFCFSFFKNFVAEYKEGSRKHKSAIATSAYQEVDYGSQNTKLNKFFDEMLKKKIEKFSRKLKVIDDANEAKNPKFDSVVSTTFVPKNEIIIPLNEKTILEEDISTNGDVKITVETGSSSSTYKPNPKMVPSFSSLSHDSSSDANFYKSKNPRSFETINDIPQSFDEKLDDNRLLEMFYANYTDGIISSNDQIINDTNSNSKSSNLF